LRDDAARFPGEVDIESARSDRRSQRALGPLHDAWVRLSPHERAVTATKQAPCDTRSPADIIDAVADALASGDGSRIGHHVEVPADHGSA